MMRELSDKLNQCFGEDLSITYTLLPNRNNSVCRQELHQKIRAQLDARKPVLVSYQRIIGIGHSVVAIGYRRESWDRLRLFCLDPARRLPYMSIWNNVIDLDYLSIDDMAITDFNYYEEEKVCVDKILIIQDEPPESVCPF